MLGEQATRCFEHKRFLRRALVDIPRFVRCLPSRSDAKLVQFSDSRTAYADLSQDMKDQLNEVVAAHSLFHSRKTVMPEYFKDMDPSTKELSFHKLVQQHESSGRMVRPSLMVGGLGLTRTEFIHRKLRASSARHVIREE